jgi:hypothetical protein
MTPAHMAFGIAAAVKLIAIFAIGPIYYPDSGEYRDIARLMLSNTQWLHDAGFNSAALPPTVFRPLGYPLILAGLTAMTGGIAPSVMVAVQSLLSLIALWCVLRVAMQIFGPASWWPAFVALAWTGSVAFLFDLAILTDSLYGSLFIIVVFSAISAWLRDSPLTAAAAAALGILWGYSMWIRGVGLVFTPLVLVPFLIVAWRHRRAGSMALIAFLVPATALAGIYMGWNHYRTGHAFIATSGQVTFLQPLFEMSKRGEKNMFTGDGPVDRLVRTEAPNFTFDELVQVNRLLFEREGFNPRQSEAAQRAAYFAKIADHPVALLRNVLRNLGPKLAQIVLDPFYTWNEVEQTVSGVRVLRGTSEWLARIRIEPHVVDMSLFAAAYLWRTLAYVAFAGFVLLPLLVAFPGIRLIQPAVLLYLWFLFVALAGLYAQIHLENRYLLPVIPAALVGVAGAFEALKRRFRPQLSLSARTRAG